MAGFPALASTLVQFASLRPLGGKGMLLLYLFVMVTMGWVALRLDSLRPWRRPRQQEPAGQATSSQMEPVADGKVTGLTAATAADESSPPATEEAPLTPVGQRRVRALILGLVCLAVAPAVPAVVLARDYASIPTIPLTLVRTNRAQSSGIQPLVNPQGIAVSAAGDLFVADAELGRLVRFSAESVRPARDVATKAPPVSFIRPWAVATGLNNQVYVLDHETGRLHYFNADGSLQRTVPVASRGARALAVDDDGSIYVGDTNVGLIRKLDPDGRPVTGWGSGPEPGAVRLDAVIGLAARDGELFAAAIHERTLFRFDRQGVPTRGPLLRSFPGELVLMADGRLLMSDEQSNRVWVLDRDGGILGRLVGASGEEQLFFQPRGLAATADGCVYIAMNNRVELFSISGTTTC